MVKCRLLLYKKATLKEVLSGSRTCYQGDQLALATGRASASKNGQHSGVKAATQIGSSQAGSVAQEQNPILPSRED